MAQTTDLSHIEEFRADSFIFDGRLDREICRLVLQPSSDWDYAETCEDDFTKDKELKYRLAPSSLNTVVTVTKWAFRQFDQTDQELRSVLKRCKYIELQPKQRVFRQGDESDAFYIVLSGRLRETATDACNTGYQPCESRFPTSIQIVGVISCVISSKDLALARAVHMEFVAERL